MAALKKFPLLLGWAALFFQISKAEKPNVVIVLADDLGIGDVSAYNENSAWKTPNIDRLAAEGIRFNDAHTSAAICTPTRYSIMTGRYNWRSTRKSGGGDGYSPPLIEKERTTLAELFKDQGYHTAMIGKWHLGWDWRLVGSETETFDDKVRPVIDFSKAIRNGPGAHGFTYSFATAASLSSPPYVWVENSRATAIPHEWSVNYDEKAFWRKGPQAEDFNHVEVLAEITDRSIGYIGERAGKKEPFFLYVALTAPHAPIIPTTEWVGKSKVNAYGDFVLQVDHELGRILDAIREKQGLKNTIIFFTSDNGQSPRADFDDDELPLAGHNGSYIFRGKKFDIFEGGHRVPFIASWPGKIRKGSRSDEVICTTDFLATAAEILGVELSDDSAEDSYSFLPVLIGENYSKPLREATVHHSSSGRFAIRRGDWKLILWPGSGGWAFPSTEEEMKGLLRFQLYNLDQDPGERNNLVSQYPERAEELKALLTKYVKEGRSAPGAPQENEGPAHWPELEWMGRGIWSDGVME
ncbi:MAG: sulfatase-like hydrolase/transferase [Opitutae bacterium]|nr:sulfatase-like hydrolase/transferase [Opitutae bacterium]